MKCISVLILSALSATAAEFVTGQAARLTIGQETFTSQLETASEWVVGGNGGVAFASNTLFVADSSRAGAGPLNHRVLIYRDVASLLPPPNAEIPYERKCPVCLGNASVVLGQPDFTTTTQNSAATQSNLRLPTAVASDGARLVVADTDHNRVLVWNRIPQTNNVPADIVIGQPNFTGSSVPGQTPNERSLRGPQGVWLHNGKLYIADTQNHRVLIYNNIPTANGAAADVVLGQPNFTTFVEPDITQAKVTARPDTLLNPVSVTSDGVRLFVADLGHNRVLIWNRIPTANAAPADVAVGQPDLESAQSNNVFKLENGINLQVLCPPNRDTSGNPLLDQDGKVTFPTLCNATMSFPRFALSDGRRLFVSDAGNDRVLVFNNIPTQSGQSADAVLGQLGGTINQATDAADSLRTPGALAWDGTNLFVSDSYNRRVNVYSEGEPTLPYTGVRNAASLEIYAVGEVALGGTIKEADEVTVKIAFDGNTPAEYKHKIIKDDTFDKVVDSLTAQINDARNGQGDENVLAVSNKVIQQVLLRSRRPGDDGNKITLETAVSTNAIITATASGANLSGGQDAAKIGPGSLVLITGTDLTDQVADALPEQDPLPTALGGVQVYFNGIRVPLKSVRPGHVDKDGNFVDSQVIAQMPFELQDTTSVNAYVRTVRNDGRIVVTSPRAVTVVAQNPGIFTIPGTSPRQGEIFHGSSSATGTISVDGSANRGDVATVRIEDRVYTYTVQEGDSLGTIRDKLIEAINNSDPQVEAYPAGIFTRIRLRARVEGPDGNGIRIAASAPEGAQVIMTATNSVLCCANVKGALITEDNPAVPGETIILRATGLGWPKGLDDPANWPTKDAVKTGYKYYGPSSTGPDAPTNQPAEFVSSLAGGKTANVLAAGLRVGAVGEYEVHLELNSDIPTNPFTQLTIAQDIYVSNIIVIPVVNPNPPAQ